MSALSLVAWTAVVTSLFWWLAWTEAKERQKADQRRRDEADQWKRREHEDQT